VTQKALTQIEASLKFATVTNYYTYN